MSFWSYWRERIKESFMKARHKAELGGFILMLVGLALLWQWPWFPLDKVLCGLLAFVFFVAFFSQICLSPYRHAKTLQSNLDNLAERIKPQMRITGGESVDKSCIVSNGNFFFRARLESLGIEPVRRVEAHVTGLRKNGQPTQLEEVVQLMMHPACQTLPELRCGVPGFVDIVRTEFDKPVLASARHYDIDTELSAGDRHEIDVVISGERVPHQTCTFLFIWKVSYPVEYQFEMLNG